MNIDGYKRKDKDLTRMIKQEEENNKSPKKIRRFEACKHDIKHRIEMLREKKKEDKIGKRAFRKIRKN